MLLKYHFGIIRSSVSKSGKSRWLNSNNEVYKQLYWSHENRKRYSFSATLSLRNIGRIWYDCKYAWFNTKQGFPHLNFTNTDPCSLLKTHSHVNEQYSFQWKKNVQNIIFGFTPAPFQLSIPLRTFFTRRSASIVINLLKKTKIIWRVIHLILVLNISFASNSWTSKDKRIILIWMLSVFIYLWYRQHR